MALGIAASQPIGVREQFGSMTKPFHPGGAARAGLMSALMAKHGYTFHGLVDPVLGDARATRLIAQCTTLAGCADLDSFTALAQG